MLKYFKQYPAWYVSGMCVVHITDVLTFCSEIQIQYLISEFTLCSLYLKQYVDQGSVADFGWSSTQAVCLKGY